MRTHSSSRAKLDAALDRKASAVEVLPIVEELFSSEAGLEDIPRFGRVLSETDLDEPQRRMVREMRRRVQERECQIEDINREEKDLLLVGLPKPKDSASKWIAVRLGKLVAEGPDRRSVMEKLREKQRDGQPLIALSVPLDQVTRFVGRTGTRFHRSVSRQRKSVA